MTAEDVQFCMIVERGPLEAQALLLSESIRHFAGRYAKARITAVSPRSDWRPATYTRDRLAELGVDYCEWDIDSPVPSYGPSFRILGLGWLAVQPGPPVMVQLDSDTLFVGEPDLELGDHLLLARPVDEIGMCTMGPGHAREELWQAMARATAVPLDAIGHVETSVGDTRVRASYNGGFIVARRQLFAETQACFEAIVAAGLRSWPDEGQGIRIGAGHASAEGFAFWGTSQAAISLAAARLGGSVRILDARHNVPIHQLERLTAIPAEPVHLHYHWLFESQKGVDSVLDSALRLAPAQIDWLRERLPLPVRVVEGVGVFSPRPVAAPRNEPDRQVDAPRCSVIMTSYEDTRFLREAVDSVLAQEFEDLELIVVDDGSPDPSPVAELAKLDSRIRTLRLDVNVGTAEAANRGIGIARGDIIARLDYDDVAEPAWLRRMMAELSADPELGLVGSAVTLIDEAGRATGMQPMPLSDFAIRFTILFHNPFYHSTTAYRRHLFELAGGYRSDHPISQDHYLWAAMLPLCRARNMPEPLVRYRISPSNSTARNSQGNPKTRTRAIRDKLWREIGIPYPLACPRLGAAVDEMLRGNVVEDMIVRRQAREVIDLAFRRVRSISEDFLWFKEKSEPDRFEEVLQRQIAANPVAQPRLGLLFRSLRERGVGETAAAVARRVGKDLKRRIPSQRAGSRDRPPLDPLMALFHSESPYRTLNPDAHPDDVQGWGSDHPAFRSLIAELRPQLILEVGSWKGASAIHMASLCREFRLATRIICVDTWLGSTEHVLGRRPGWRESLRPLHGFPQLYYSFLANVLRTGHASRIIPLPNTSENAAVILRETGIEPQLIYLDAAHEEDSVYRDLQNFWALLAPNGVMLGDDYAKYPGVRRAANRFAAEAGVALEDLGDKFILRKK